MDKLKTPRKRQHSAPRPAPSSTPTRRCASRPDRRLPERLQQPGYLDRAKDFQRRKYDAGFTGLHWPAEWAAAPPIHTIIYNQEEAKYDVLAIFDRLQHEQRELRAAHAGRGGVVPAVQRAERWSGAAHEGWRRWATSG